MSARVQSLLLLLVFVCHVFSAHGFSAGISRSAFGARRLQVVEVLMAQPAPAPATKTKTRTVTKPAVGSPAQPAPAQKTVTAQPKLETVNSHVPMWKVLLLGDEEYEEDSVCGVITQVIPDISMDEIRQKFHEAQAVGDSLLTIVNQEHAEAYVSQLQRGMPMVFADAQPE